MVEVVIVVAVLVVEVVLVDVVVNVTVSGLAEVGSCVGGKHSSAVWYLTQSAKLYILTAKTGSESLGPILPATTPARYITPSCSTISGPPASPCTRPSVLLPLLLKHRYQAGLRVLQVVLQELPPYFTIWEGIRYI